MSRTYRDPIHKEIFLDSKDTVENLIIKLIDSREMQRLRWIRQLGTGWFTFHGAEASRFQHSLGTMFIAKQMLEKIQRDINFDSEIYTRYKALVLSAALLHDIGHGPFSHSTEDVNDIKHEVWTKRILEEKDTELYKLLEGYEPGFSKDVISILDKTYPVKFLCNLVNSQLDCDRFDYLLRDSYHTGTSYGNFDLNRVITSITVDLENDCLVVAGEKGMLAVEDYLYARYSMYLQVYQHKKCLASDSLLLKLLQRVKVLIKTKKISYLENCLEDWLVQPKKTSVQDYLKVDDINLMHHIKHWAEEKDIILKDLAKRFITRKIFKAEKIAKNTNLEELYKEKSQLLRKQNLDPDYYLDIVTIASSSYSFYNPDTSDFFKAIFVKDNDANLKEISTISHVVNSLVNNDFENSWLISNETSTAAQALLFS
jgi:HD superfamily phosphohydrolase